MEEILEIKNLDDYDLFHECNFSIKKNTITSLSGANNCGKTTLLRILSINKYQKEGIVFLNKKDITEYSKEEYDSFVQSVFPLDRTISDNNVLDEICINQVEIDMTKIEYLLKELNLLKYKEKEVNKLDKKDLIKLQIIKAILNAKELVLIDHLEDYFTIEEIKKLYSLFHKCIKKYDLTFLITCINLNTVLLSDELIIIKDGKVVLQGKPIEVLEKDNMINKSGLELPFMIDLTDKLKDYDLISKIECEKEKLIELLWK